ncbi:MAG: polysaccharide deacetylase family protein [Marinoscillum sp.]|uniref:polysaccharide deacetylase family protein n=1 Tax=Marinoscillum sp. TaxID=2024838 RepID=UPI0032FE88F7
MRRYFLKNPFWVRWRYPGAVWKVPTTKRELFLTFDDGPHPVATPYVLDLLAKYQARATFFCVGTCIERSGHLMERMVRAGHMIGNHTHSHPDGWVSDTASYLEEVTACQNLIGLSAGELLFRPPYGNLRFRQLKALKKAGYQIIMWSHLSGDFDQALDREQSVGYMKKADSGSILVFHDSEKAFENLREMLPRVLEHFSTLGYSFKTLSNL